MRIRGNLIERDFHYEPDTQSQMVDAAIHALIESDDAKPVARPKLRATCAYNHALEGANRLRDGSCRSCRKMRRRKTHCPQGHSFADRGKLNNQGVLICLECAMVKSRAYRAEKSRVRKPQERFSERPAH